MRQIVIEDAVLKPQGVLGQGEPPRLDVQDWLLIVGIAFLEAAAIVIWWPAALIMAGCFCLGFSYLIERSKKNGTVKP